MKTAKNYKFWFATGSQDLYGDECLQKVAEHSKIIVNELNKSGILPYEVYGNQPWSQMKSSVKRLMMQMQMKNVRV